MAVQKRTRQGNPWLSGIRWHDVDDENEDEAAVSGIEGVPGAGLSPGEPPAAPTTDNLPVTGDLRQIAEQAAMLKAIEAFKMEPGVDDLSEVQLPKYLDARLKNYDPPSAYSLAVGSASYPAEGFMGSKVPMSIMDQLASQLGGQASLIQWADAMGWSDARVKGALAGGATYFPSQAIAAQAPLQEPARMSPTMWGGFMGSQDPAAAQRVMAQQADAQAGGFWHQPSRPPGVTSAGANALFPQMSGRSSDNARVAPNFLGNNIPVRQSGGGGARQVLDSRSPTRTWVPQQTSASRFTPMGYAAEPGGGPAPAAVAPPVTQPYITNPGSAARSYFDYAVGSRPAASDTPVISINREGGRTPGYFGFGKGMGSITGGGGGGGGMTAAQAEQAKIDWARMAQDKAIADAQIAAQRRAAAMQLAAQAAQVQSQNWQTGLPVTLPKGTMYAPGMEYGGPANVLSDIAGASYSPQQLAVSNPPSVQSLIDKIIGRYS